MLLKATNSGDFIVVPNGSHVWLRFSHAGSVRLFSLDERKWIRSNDFLDGQEVNVLHTDFYHGEQCVARSFKKRPPQLIPADEIINPRENFCLEQLAHGAIFSDGLQNRDIHIKISLSETINLSTGELTTIPSDIRLMSLAVLLLSGVFYLDNKVVGMHG